jgi:hypothetical protein
VLISQAYRNHDVYKMQSMASMCSPVRGAPFGGSVPADRQYLDTYEVDKRSIFVGNLLVETRELDLLQKFEKYGPIHRVTLHKNESVVDGTVCFTPLVTLLNFSSQSKALLCFH